MLVQKNLTPKENGAGFSEILFYTVHTAQLFLQFYIVFSSGFRMACFTALSLTYFSYFRFFLFVFFQVRFGIGQKEKIENQSKLNNYLWQKRKANF
jgi:hypothetical protein